MVNSKKQAPHTIDVVVPDPEVCKEFGVTAMTLWRWDHDPRMAELGWPPAIIIRNRNSRSRKLLEQFKANMLRRAFEARNAKADAS